MSDYTKHLRLIKPAGNEYYNVDHFNHNAELIDKETEDLSNKVAKIQEGATREKAGIVQFGTVEGKALEGMMLARLAGCVGYGGDIQEPGVKDINYIYYDRNTRKMYKCLNQNSDVSANVANFIPLDNNSLLDRLENLFNIKTYGYHNTEDVNSDMYIHYTVLKIMNICILEIKFARVANKDIVMPANPLPAEFRPKSIEYLSAIASTGGIKMDYHWLRLEPNGHFYTHNNAGITVRNLQTTIAYIAAN